MARQTPRARLLYSRLLAWLRDGHYDVARLCRQFRVEPEDVHAAMSRISSLPSWHVTPTLPVKADGRWALHLPRGLAGLHAFQVAGYIISRGHRGFVIIDECSEFTPAV